MGSRYSSRHDSTECAICCHRKWTRRGNKKVEKNPGNSFKLGFEPIVINGFTNLWPLALFSAVFYWVSLGCISVPLQKWILEVDGANQLAVLPKNFPGEKGSMFVSSLEPLGVYFRVPCSFSEGVHDF